MKDVQLGKLDAGEEKVIEERDGVLEAERQGRMALGKGTWGETVLKIIAEGRIWSEKPPPRPAMKEDWEDLIPPGTEVIRQTDHCVAPYR